jgi:putative transcriptional regulator
MKKASRLSLEILEMAEAQNRLGLMDDAAFAEIKARHQPPMTAAPLTAAEIRQARERAELTQEAFAAYIGVTSGFVSQLERGTKIAQGPVLAVLNIIRRLGFNAIRG